MPRSMRLVALSISKKEITKRTSSAVQAHDTTRPHSQVIYGDLVETSIPD